MRRIGVYVHFPWCLKKCPYCDFVSFAKDRKDIDHARYASAVVAELDKRRAPLEEAQLESVFFGGGTPSLWEPAELGRVLAAILAAAPNKAEDVEVTVECNPTSLDAGRARQLRDVGVNRLSVGVQGLDPARLAFLGRLHDPDGALAAVRAALDAGVPRVSGDLIYGVSGQAAETAAIEADRVAATGVTHVSAYSLTIEEGTQFGELARRGKLPTLPEDSVAESFLAIDEALTKRGLVHYEISNYARPGDEARHNLGYWRGDDYLGLGCAAYGTLSSRDGAGAVRARNEPDPERYMKAALAGEPTAVTEEALDGETRMRERIMLGLRLAQGFDVEAAASDLGVDPWPARRKQAVEKLVGRGRVEVDGSRLRIARSSWLFADGTAAELF